MQTLETNKLDNNKLLVTTHFVITGGICNVPSLGKELMIWRSFCLRAGVPALRSLATSLLSPPTELYSLPRVGWNLISVSRMSRAKGRVEG